MLAAEPAAREAILALQKVDIPKPLRVRRAGSARTLTGPNTGLLMTKDKQTDSANTYMSFRNQDYIFHILDVVTHLIIPVMHYLGLGI